MTTEHDPASAAPEGPRPAPAQQQQQQQQPADGQGHAGRGSDSAMKQMRIWEEQRARISGGKQRQGPE